MSCPKLVLINKQKKVYTNRLLVESKFVFMKKSEPKLTLYFPYAEQQTQCPRVGCGKSPGSQTPLDIK